MSNKTYLSVVLFVLFLISFTYNSTTAQVIVKNNETIGITGNTFYLKLDKYIGDIQWEKSDDGISWIEVLNEKNDSIPISTEINSFYRAKVTVNNCDSFYSDTTQFKRGEIVSLKSSVFPDEICFLKTENIVLDDSLVQAKLNGENIELRYTGKYLVFLMPKLTNINPKLDLVINTRGYSFDYSLLEPLPESSLNQFYSDFVTSNNVTAINLKNTVNELIKLDSVNFRNGYFDRFLFVLDSIQNELNQFSNNLSPQEIQQIAQIMAANPLLFTNESTFTKSAKVINVLSSSPEAMLEDLPGYLIEKTEELEVASSQAGGYFDLVFDAISGRIIGFVFKKIQTVISKALENLLDIKDKKEMLESYMKIKEIIANTRNQVRNPYYMQEGFIDTGNPLTILEFKSNESMSLDFLSWYVQMTNTDLEKFPDIKNTLNRFNLEFNRTNKLPFHQVFIAFGFPGINKLYPILAREPEPYNLRARRRFAVENKYIVSQEADIKSSISNANVKLKEFSKDIDGPLNLQFENLTNEEQAFNFSVNYEHKGYSKSTTSLSAVVLPSDTLEQFLIENSPWDWDIGREHAIFTFNGNNQGILEWENEVYNDSTGNWEYTGTYDISGFAWGTNGDTKFYIIDEDDSNIWWMYSISSLEKILSTLVCAEDANGNRIDLEDECRNETFVSLKE